MWIYEAIKNPYSTCQEGFEPPTHGLEGRCSVQLSYWHTYMSKMLLRTILTSIKAGDGNRTHVSSLEGWCSTIELHPQIIWSLFTLTKLSGWQDLNLRPPGPKPGALAKLSHTPSQRKCYYKALSINLSTVFCFFILVFHQFFIRRFLPDTIHHPVHSLLWKIIFTISRRAFPLWLIRFFSEGSSSADVQP